VTARLTELAQAAVRERIRPGDAAVDATAGNGHDTVFLAAAVGPGGRVFAFDTQPAAIRATRRRLRAEGMGGTVELIEACHSRLPEFLPRSLELNAAMFNLGYLPGSDKRLVTQSTTTVAALAASLERLAQRGLVTVTAYRGHPGGASEASAVAASLDSLPAGKYTIERHSTPADGPLLWVIQRSN
jgi:precorrin-6B methylase 2